MIEAAPQEQEPKGFEELSPARKLETVLALVREPVEKDFALRLAGIDVASLSEAEQREVEAIFENPDTHSGDEFMLNSNAKDRVLMGIDVKSVNARMAYVLEEILFGEGGLDAPVTDDEGEEIL